MPSRHLNSLVLNGIVVCASTAVGCLTAELLVALIQPQPTWRKVRAESPAMHVSDPVVAHTLRAGFSGVFIRPEFNTQISINSQGFRGDELLESPQNRILVLGDSFTFGHGVQDGEAYPSLVDVMMPAVEVVNGGFVAGSSPDMYYAWLRAGGLDADFDGLLIGFFLGNDIDRHPEMKWLAVDSSGLPTKIVNTESYVSDHYLQSYETPVGYRYPVFKNSHLFHLLGSGFRQLQNQLNGPPVPSPSVFDSEWTAETRERVRTTQRVFEGLFSLAAQADIPLAILMIPTLQQVVGDAPTTVQRVFLEFFESHGVPALDLFPSLRGHPEAYYKVDQHWNPLGHAIAAEALVEWFPDSALPPGAVAKRK